jgi:hypothetical protein
MSGSRAKKLRKALEETAISLLPQGWKKLKRAWTRTPRPERQSFDVTREVLALRRADEATVRKWLDKKSPAEIKTLRKRVLGK